MDPCDGVCLDDFYTQLCVGGGKGGKDVCIPETSSCNGACNSPDLPVPVPFYHLCTTEEACRDSTDTHLCDGACIPIEIPCNGICAADSGLFLGRRKEMFGPVFCEGAISRIIPDMYRDPGGFDAETVGRLEGAYQLDNEWKLCLHGEVPCGGRCGVVDPRVPYLDESGGRIGGKCVAQCGSRREWPCNGKCISRVSRKG